MAPFVDLTQYDNAPREVQFLRELPRSRRRSPSDLTIHSDAATEDEIENEVIDLTLDESDLSHHTLVKAGEFPITRARSLENDVLHVEDFIEIKQHYFGKYKIEFLHIKSIVRNSHEVLVRGIPLARTRDLGGKLPNKKHELCFMYHFLGDTGSCLPTYVDVWPSDILKKREVILTNRTDQRHTLLTPLTAPSTATRGLILICRWRMDVYSVYANGRTKPQEEVLRRLTDTEIPTSLYTATNEDLSEQWRGKSRKGGSWRPGDHDIPLGMRAPGQKYTLFDSFSGAGGVSRGAQMAGLKVRFAVDKAPDVWDTYHANFPRAKLYRMSVDAFIQASQSRQIRVDFLHLSPPCQFFSPAHTQPSVNDDENIFALLGCYALIEKTRPRIITLEQTFGITHERHAEYLKTVIGDITDFGYSLRWKVVRLASWGSAQDRKRLIIIAAGPGEKLPPFPKATHSGSPGDDGLKPFHTIEDALSGIRRDDSLHDLGQVRYFHPRRAPYDPKTLAGTICTNGGMFYHPSGQRELSLREIAALQGFPHHHIFDGNKTSVRRQIGNAFPPNTVRVLYSHLERWLLAEDGMQAYKPNADAVMTIDENLSHKEQRADLLLSEVVEMIDLT